MSTGNINSYFPDLNGNDDPKARGADGYAMDNIIGIAQQQEDEKKKRQTNNK